MPKGVQKQSNTLLNYFQSPKRSPLCTKSLNKTNESSDQADSDDDNPIVMKRKKNASIINSDSDSDQEHQRSLNKKNKKKNTTTGTSQTNKRKLSSSFDSGNETPSKKKSLSLNASINKKSNAGDLLNKSANESITEETIGSSIDDNWEHNKIDWLHPNNIRDSSKRRPDDADYDKNTVHVPESFLKDQTPAMHQWWILKSKHYDSVLFFKVGKFYELYHMDAVTGVNHLGLTYMKGSFAHSGFPEIAYGRMASSLVDQGFKVARIEQTETPEMMAERCRNTRKPTKFDKVVNREICQITTKATCIYNAQLQDAKQSLLSYMIAITAKGDASGNRFGICFIDTSIGVFNMAEFDDDRFHSRLLSLMAQHPPQLILTERGCVQSDIVDMLKRTYNNIRHESLSSKSQFHDAQETLNIIMSSCYFFNKEGEFEWPAVLSDLLENGHPKAGHELSWKSLGACIWYLKNSEIDIHVLSLKKFAIYDHNDVTIENVSGINFMVLDAMTLEHLDVLGGDGSLQKTLDYCSTQFGKRLLQQWICRPLCAQKSIELRQEAVEELITDNDLRSSTQAILKKLPDLERLVVKIHGFGNRFVAKNHPDSRAIFYEAATYSGNKIRNLITSLQAFETIMKVVEIFSECKSTILKDLTQFPPLGKFRDLTSVLDYFKHAFDQNEAQTKAKIIPVDGIDEEYDSANQEIKQLESKIEQYRCEQEKIFRCKVSYHGTGKNRYQIEIPETKCSLVKSAYKLQGTKKGAKPVRRYSTVITYQFVADMTKAEAKRDKIVQDLNRRIFEKFSERSEDWQQVIQCLSELDVICSFAQYAKNTTHTICFPKVYSFSDEPYIKIENGVHPCTKLENFVPNNTYLGWEKQNKLMILTGPNMGGKSTLMRQVALITIMAQMGCAVPAESCQLTLVDRIFTRIGAQDDILQGNSTFMVELSEASAILQHATKHSFVLIDELGRGTSTHDGNAIASAYLNKLISMQSRTIFSTHYHSLVERFAKLDDIQLAHMACLSNDEQTDSPKISVTLLYQLREGNCPKSYGFNAAKMANLPSSIIENAYKVAQSFEKQNLRRSYFYSILNSPSEDVIRIIRILSDLDI